MKYTIEITETFSKTIVLEADSYEQAIREADGLYNVGKIPVGEGDYRSTNITVIDRQPSQP